MADRVLDTNERNKLVTILCAISDFASGAQRRKAFVQAAGLGRFVDRIDWAGADDVVAGNLVDVLNAHGFLRRFPGDPAPIVSYHAVGKLIDHLLNDQGVGAEDATFLANLVVQHGLDRDPNRIQAIRDEYGITVQTPVEMSHHKAGLPSKMIVQSSKPNFVPRMQDTKPLEVDKRVDALVDTEPGKNHRVELRQALVNRFSESELKDLCFDLGIDYETLGGENKLDKARQLVLFCEHHDRIPDLDTAVSDLRPGISWSQTPNKIVDPSYKVSSPLEGSVNVNPYSNRRAIRAPKDFHGRSYEVRTALTLLASLQSLSVVGPRRFGKSSLLYHISDPTVLKDHAIDPDQFVFIFLSCEQLMDLSRDQIYQVMLNQARAAMSKTQLQIAPAAFPSPGMTFFDFSQTLSGFTQLGCKLIFLLDEFECLAGNSSLDKGFFTGLRSIANNSDVAYVTASGRSLGDLTYVEKSVLGSPFFNIFSTIRLGLFEDDDARELICGPSRAAGVNFSEATSEFILSLTDHHPFFIQIACFHAFDIQSQKETLTEADYQLIQERAREGLQDHLKFAWGHLKSEEMRLLFSLETAQDDLRYRPIVRSLHEQGVICQHDNRYHLCALWADFVRSQSAEAGDPEPRNLVHPRTLSAQPG